MIKLNDFFRDKVFILGPSHHVYLPSCALPTSQCTAYETPLGNLRLDNITIEALRRTGEFDEMGKDVDEDEHSIEMHLPYIRHIFKKSEIGPNSLLSVLN